MKIVCIDIESVDWNMVNLLTVGKTYITDWEDDIRYKVECDNGQHLLFYKSRFIQVYKIRDEKIDQILK